jgi:transposase
MNFVGIDLHKQIIVVCVRNEQRAILTTRKFACSNEAQIVEFFASLGKYQAVVEATASYEWLWKLLEPTADRLVLAHPKRMRVIAETKYKTDKLDAEKLSEFLALGLIPEAFRPTERQREHRVLVRYRQRIKGRITAVRCRIRHVLANYNKDRKDLFTLDGQEYLKTVAVSPADRFVLDELVEQWQDYCKRLAKINRKLKEFAKSAPVAEQEARAVLATIPYVGAVTIDAVVSELGDVRRFRSQKHVVAYAGLAPGVRASASRRHDLHITKEGSRILRWAMVEAAWRVVAKTARWGYQYQRLKQRLGAKKAIVAIARRLLCVIAAMLRRGERYRPALA